MSKFPSLNKCLFPRTYSNNSTKYKEADNIIMKNILIKVIHTYFELVNQVKKNSVYNRGGLDSHPPTFYKELFQFRLITWSETIFSSFFDHVHLRQSRDRGVAPIWFC